jgi:signal transduction histidine kinase
MRLLPRSLFGRVTLIVAGGFLAAQLLTTALNIADREALVSRVGATQAAVRIGDIVRVLQAASPPERSRIMRAAANETLRLEYGKPAGSDAAGSGESELMTAAREALALALEPGTGFRVFDAQFVHNETGWFNLEFRERPGVRIRSAVLLNDGTWITAESTDPPRMSRWFNRMLQNLAIIDAVMLVLCYVAVRLVTRPLSLLAGAAEELGRDIDRPPLPERGATELVRASRALNTMQDRLKRYVETRLKVLAAMSHDLKTPITRLRLRAEMLEDAQLKTKITRDLDAMQAMVASALDYMRGLSDGGEAPSPIDIGALISSLKEDAEEAGNAVSVQGEASGPVSGRAQALKRCLQNLLDNALAYGQRAEIKVRDLGQAVSIAISDHGPGIPETEMEKVFEPFYRLESSRNRNTGGSGLGLSIARNIAQAHGGTLTLRNLARGGLEATLLLPRTP